MGQMAQSNMARRFIDAFQQKYVDHFGLRIGQKMTVTAVELGCRSDGEEVVLCVELVDDAGNYFPLEGREVLFDPGFIDVKELTEDLAEVLQLPQQDVADRLRVSVFS